MPSLFEDSSRSKSTPQDVSREKTGQTEFVCLILPGRPVNLLRTHARCVIGPTASLPL
jgi:hypothetical protein